MYSQHTVVKEISETWKGFENSFMICIVCNLFFYPTISQNLPHLLSPLINIFNVSLFSKTNFQDTCFIQEGNTETI